jgi:hypothetical protein
MPEVAGKGLEELADRIAQLSERQAANARILLEEIQRRRSEAREQGRNFSAPTGAQVLDRLRSARSPFIHFLEWPITTPSPGTMNLGVGIMNPDPVTQSSLEVYVFVGPAALVADVGQALAVADTRFHNLTEPPAFGLTLAPSATADLNFAVKVPDGIEPSNYIGNVFLFRDSLFDVSDVLSRADFIFQVT